MSALVHVLDRKASASESAARVRRPLPIGTRRFALKQRIFVPYAYPELPQPLASGLVIGDAINRTKRFPIDLMVPQ